MAIERISISRARAYEQCPLYYDAIYNKNKEQRGDHLYFGSIIHKVLELYHRNPQKDIMDIYDEVWVQYPLTDLGFYKDGREMLNDYLIEPAYHVNPVAKDADGVLLLEKFFRIPLDDNGDIIASGVIDRIDHIDSDTCEIIDYKTSRMPYTREELENDTQATLYTLAAMQDIAPQYKNYKISFFFLRYGKFSTQRTVEDIENFRHYLINLYYQILFDTEYEPKLNTYCNYCPIKNSECELYKNLTRDEKLLLGEFPGSESEILKQLDDVKNKERAIRARRDELENSLKTILETKPEEGIIIDNKRVYLQPRRQSSYSYELVAELLGENVARSMANITKGNVDKKIRGNKELMDLFDQRKTEYYTRPSIRIQEV